MSIVSQFMRQVHVDAVLRILRYLKIALGKGLFFSKHGHTQSLHRCRLGWISYRHGRLLGIAHLLEATWLLGEVKSSQ